MNLVEKFNTLIPSLVPSLSFLRHGIVIAIPCSIGVGMIDYFFREESELQSYRKTAHSFIYFTVFSSFLYFSLKNDNFLVER